jgi:acyl-CoA hydrolase
MGRADLRGRDYHGRAEALIAIAAPAHRPTLATEWRDYARAL